ncbi:MAG: hypothetical protein V8R80_09610 [Eubacterium sp.]
MAGGANRTVNELQPIVDTRLSDGSRVNVVSDRPHCTRRFLYLNPKIFPGANDDGKADRIAFRFP